jgi:hypothetical protein
MEYPIAVLLISLSCMLAGAITGALLRKRLPEHHLNTNSATLVRAGVGLISTMAALVLGLLISSATVSYNSTASQLSDMTADFVMVDQLLAQYGQGATHTREALRSAVKQLVKNVWVTADHMSSRSRPFVSTEGWQQFSRSLQDLPQRTKDDRSLRKGVDEAINRVAQARLHIFSESGKNLPKPFLVAVVFWLTIIFTSYTLFAELNPTVMVFILFFALSSAGALYLIGELNSPFQGMLELPKGALEGSLVPLPR